MRLPIQNGHRDQDAASKKHDRNQPGIVAQAIVKSRLALKRAGNLTPDGAAQPFAFGCLHHNDDDQHDRNDYL